MPGPAPPAPAPSRSRVPPAVVAAARVGPSPLPPTAPFAVTLSVQEIAADRRSHLGKVIVEWTDGCSGQDPILKWTIIAKNMADGSEVNVEVLAPTTQAEVDALYIFLNPLHARLGTVVSGLTPGATYTFAVRTTSARHLVGEMSTASKSLTLSGTASVTPGQVIDVVATKVEFKRGQLELTWRAPPAPCGDPATEFTITSTPPLSGGSANVVVTNTTRTMLHDLATDGTAYTFTIVSRTAKGIESVVSNPSGAVATWSDDDEVARNDGSDGWAAANHRQVPLKKHSRGFVSAPRSRAALTPHRRCTRFDRRLSPSSFAPLFFPFRRVIVALPPSVIFGASGRHQSNYVRVHRALLLARAQPSLRAAAALVSTVVAHPPLSPPSSFPSAASFVTLPPSAIIGASGLHQTRYVRVLRAPLLARSLPSLRATSHR